MKFYCALCAMAAVALSAVGSVSEPYVLHVGAGGDVATWINVARVVVSGSGLPGCVFVGDGEIVVLPPVGTVVSLK